MFSFYCCRRCFIGPSCSSSSSIAAFCCCFLFLSHNASRASCGSRVVVVVVVAAAAGYRRRRRDLLFLARLLALLLSCRSVREFRRFGLLSHAFLLVILDFFLLFLVCYLAVYACLLLFELFFRREICILCASLWRVVRN